jgi:hypothetical protein
MDPEVVIVGSSVLSLWRRKPKYVQAGCCIYCRTPCCRYMGGQHDIFCIRLLFLVGMFGTLPLRSLSLLLVCCLVWFRFFF